MSKKIGLIGSGNMARAIIKGIVKSEIYSKSDIYVSDKDTDSLNYVKDEFGVNVLHNNTELARLCDIIFLCVKPNKYEYVCHEIDTFVNDNAIIISIAPGQKMDIVKGYFTKDVKVFSSMPNTPAKVLSGMSAVCTPVSATYEEIESVLEIFKCFGEAEIVEEDMLSAIVALSGSSPAFIYILIEAMADQGVAFGLSRDKALKFASNAVLGSAKMVIEDSDHVAKLKDNVCSPGGTTIQGVLKLEETGFRTSVQKAMLEVYNKSNNM